MPKMRIGAALIFLMIAPCAALGQGFAGLGTQTEGFARVERGKLLRFPRDHGAHPDYRIEWWYLTANLTGADGQSYGLQWTLFRSALRPPDRNPGHAAWASPQLWMGHAAVTTKGQHWFAETRARGGVGLAGVRAAPFEAWINDWRMSSNAAPHENALSRLALRASGAQFSYELELVAKKPLALHGAGGYSVKSVQGQASYYYSQPFFEIAGRLRLPEGEVKVTGKAWLDREWSTQPLAANQKGWDWLSLHLDDGSKLMGFRLRNAKDGGFVSGSWIAPDGGVTPLGPQDLILTPLQTARVAGRRIPIKWRVRMPGRNLEFTVAALNPQSWMGASISYWEGPVTVRGKLGGVGYLEMTGY